MWERSVDEAIEKLVGTTAASNLTFVGSWQYGSLSARLEHLACFFPGGCQMRGWQEMLFIYIACLEMWVWRIYRAVGARGWSTSPASSPVGARQCFAN